MQGTIVAEQAVQISFNCLPLRLVAELDVPEEASPKFQALCHRLQAALQKHGAYNTYYLHNAKCVFRLTNAAESGSLTFQFEGTIFTNENDTHTAGTDLSVQLESETCDWLTEPVVDWFHLTVVKAVHAEFDRYIQAGDLQKSLERVKRIQEQSDAQGGFLGMYL